MLLLAAHAGTLKVHYIYVTASLQVTIISSQWSPTLTAIQCCSLVTGVKLAHSCLLIFQLLSHVGLWIKFPLIPITLFWYIVKWTIYKENTFRLFLIDPVLLWSCVGSGMALVLLVLLGVCCAIYHHRRWVKQGNNWWGMVCATFLR